MRVKKLLAMFLLVLLLCQPMLALQSLASAESSGYSEEPSIVRELTELRSTAQAPSCGMTALMNASSIRKINSTVMQAEK